MISSDSSCDKFVARKRIVCPSHIVTCLPSQERVRRSKVVLTPTRRVSWYPRRVIKGSGFPADYSLVVTCMGSWRRRSDW
jgi:hypothetical protein